MTQVRMSGEQYAQIVRVISAARTARAVLQMVQDSHLPGSHNVRVALNALAATLDDSFEASVAEPDPPMLYGVWHIPTKLWCASSSGCIVSSSSKDISTSTWGTEAEIEVREIPPAMRWWLARGVNVVG